MGRRIHEPPSIPNFDDPHAGDLLTVGLVITVEPIITGGRSATVDGDDGWAIRTRDGSMTAHHEETIVVTKGEPLILTAA